VVDSRLLTAEARIAPKPVHVSFVVGKVALGRDSLSLSTSGFPSHIPPAIFVDVHLNTAPAEGLEDEAWEPSNKATVYLISRENGGENKIFFFCLGRVNHKSLKFLSASCHIGFQGQCPKSKQNFTYSTYARSLQKYVKFTEKHVCKIRA
jgi:hypothetical protein